jgi:hypothetical protein
MRAPSPRRSQIMLRKVILGFITLVLAVSVGLIAQPAEPQLSGHLLR